jgi:hypothetical protein
MDLREPPITDNEDLNIWLNDVYEWLKYPALKAYTIQTGAMADGNYAEFETDGTLKFVGDATVWDDQQIIIGGVKFAGASDPSWTPYKGGRVLAFDKGQNNIIYFTAQLSHKYKASSNINFHIHTVHADGDAGNSIWHLTHSWADIGEDFPAQSTVDKTIASPSDADKHEEHDFSSTISVAGAVRSSILLCSLQREGTDDLDTYDDDIYLVAMDFHLEMDTVGSRTEATK